MGQASGIRIRPTGAVPLRLCRRIQSLVVRRGWRWRVGRRRRRRGRSGGIQVQRIRVVLWLWLVILLPSESVRGLPPLLLIRRLSVHIVARLGRGVRISLRRPRGRHGRKSVGWVLVVRGRCEEVRRCLRRRTGIVHALLFRRVALRRRRAAVRIRGVGLEIRGYGKGVKLVLRLGLLHLVLPIRDVWRLESFQRRHVCIGIGIGIVLVPLSVCQLCVDITLKVGPMITERRVQCRNARHG